MATVDPIAQGAAGWIDPYNSVPLKAGVGTVVIKTNTDPTLRSYHFSAVNSADTWDTEFDFGQVAGCWVQNVSATEYAQGSVVNNSGAARIGFICDADPQEIYVVLKLNRN